MVYSLMVQFQREEGDDAAVVGKESLTDYELVVQFVKEMQEAIDSIGLPAGHFKVISLQRGKTISWDPDTVEILPPVK